MPFPTSQPWTGHFLWAKTKNKKQKTSPSTFHTLAPCHCSGLENHLLREVSSKKSKAGMPVPWMLHLVYIPSSTCHRTISALLHGCIPGSGTTLSIIHQEGCSIPIGCENREDPCKQKIKNHLKGKYWEQLHQVASGIYLFLLVKLYTPKILCLSPNP